MNILVRKSSYIIRKGDGVYAYYDGQPHLLTSPPPEAFHPSKDKPDVPLFAHYGNGKPHPNGHHGMGELIQGDFIRGKYDIYNIPYIQILFDKFELLIDESSVDASLTIMIENLQSKFEILEFISSNNLETDLQSL